MFADLGDWIKQPNMNHNFLRQFFIAGRPAMKARSKLSEFQREWLDLQPDLQERSNKKAEQLIQHGKKRRKSDQSHKPGKNTVISPSSPISPSTYVCILST